MSFSEAVALRGLDPQYNRWNALIEALSGGDASLSALYKAIIAAESGWVEGAQNPDGSTGLMQILAGPNGPVPDHSALGIARRRHEHRARYPLHQFPARPVLGQ